MNLYLCEFLGTDFPCGGSFWQLTPNGFVPVCSFDTPDGLYDCTWSEVACFPSFSHLFLFLFMRITCTFFVVVSNCKCGDVPGTSEIMFFHYFA
jgi:hypothetical protein